jgi:hypothetical protein
VAVPLVVDTDIGSDVDDALALALAVRHPDLELRAVTTVSSQPDVRAQLARRLLDVAGAVDVEVAVGTNVAGDERNAIGAEHLDLLAPPSDGAPAANAVDLLAGLGRDMSLATIGQQTNLAAALARDSALARRAASLTVMGGAFAPIDGTGAKRTAPRATGTSCSIRGRPSCRSPRDGGRCATSRSTSRSGYRSRARTRSGFAAATSCACSSPAWSTVGADARFPTTVRPTWRATCTTL